jgi:hypothetical protein
MSDEISEQGLFNKNVLAECLEQSGFDSEYLFEWGLPSFWEKAHWHEPMNVLDLLAYFEEVYKTYDTRDSLEEELN